MQIIFDKVADMKIKTLARKDCLQKHLLSIFDNRVQNIVETGQIFDFSTLSII